MGGKVNALLSSSVLVAVVEEATAVVAVESGVCEGPGWEDIDAIVGIGESLV